MEGNDLHRLPHGRTGLMKRFFGAPFVSSFSLLRPCRLRSFKTTIALPATIIWTPGNFQPPCTEASTARCVTEALPNFLILKNRIPLIAPAATKKKAKPTPFRATAKPSNRALGKRPLVWIVTAVRMPSNPTWTRNRGLIPQPSLQESAASVMRLKGSSRNTGSPQTG